ncbi:MAG: tRNA pseudouridine(13) synthase TruD [Sedimentisphaerales bacterium]|nr:tRNA pseudouridine(13) synthase TruD [Sedimentisphaerales bacterium]
MDETPAFLTADLPGIGGVIKTRYEDFVVEELPLYEASGTGSHVYAFIEKRGLGTREALSRIAQALGTSPRAIGSAGLKDTHAVTRQWVSVENAEPERLERAGIADIRVLKVTRHTNKLKPGHLAGNRFVVRLRQTSVPIEQAARTAEQVLAVLTLKGVPNYFGPQRFGNRCDNHLLGKAVIDNDPTRVIDLFIGRPDPKLDSAVMFQARTFYAEGRYQEALDIWPRQIPERRRILKTLVINRGSKNRAFHVMDKHLKGFFVSAYQSAVFNRVLSARMPEIDKLLTGDMAYKHDNGACFHVEDAAVEQPRCDRFEISPTGPLVGLRTSRLTGPAAAIEDPILAAEGLGESPFRQMKRLGARGGRRPLRFQPRHAGLSTGADDLGEYLELRFELDPGCYATTLLAEITKTPTVDTGAAQSADDADTD